MNQTWAYANGTWTNIASTAGTPPDSRYGGSLVYSPHDGYLDLLGGQRLTWEVLGYNNSRDCWPVFCNDSWSFENGTWSQLPVPSSNPFQNLTLNGTLIYYEGSVATYDSTTGTILLVAGHFPANVRSNASWNETRADTWSISGSSWADLTTNTTVGAADLVPDYLNPVVADDPEDGGVLLFGGWLTTYNGTLDEHASNATWLYAAGVWTNLTGAAKMAPPASGGNANDLDQSMTYDPATGSVVLFDQGTTWVWQNRTWVEQTPAQSPSAWGPAFAWDGASNAPLLFGGTSSGGPYSASTWEWTTNPPLSNLTLHANPNPVVAGNEVNFSAGYLGGVPPLTYDWSFGDGATSSSPDPSHGYSSAGNFTVRLALSDANGHSVNATQRVEVAAVASLDPSVGPNPTDVGLNTRFSSGAVGGIPLREDTFEWAFGDGAMANSSNASHQYSAAGNYTASVWWNDTSSNSSAGARLVQSVGVRVNPALGVPTITASPRTPALGELVNFSAQVQGGSAPYTYSWSFGDGGTGGNLSNLSHIFTTNGPFTVAVTVADRAGATVAGTVPVSVALNLSILSNATLGASPLPVGFTSDVRGGTGPYTYAWSFGDGAASTAADPSHVYSVAGAYAAELVTTDSEGASVRSQIPILVVSGGGPLKASVVANPSTAALGAPVTIAATVHGGAGRLTVTWPSAPAGCSESGPLVLACSPSTAGTYSVTIQVSDAGGGGASASTAFSVGNLGTSHGGGPSVAGLSLPESVGALAAVAVVAASAAYAVARRGPPRVGAGEAASHAESSAAVPEPSAEEKAALDDIF